MKNMKNRWKNMFAKRQTVIKKLVMCFIVGLFSAYTIYAISNQPLLISESPLNNVAEDVSRVSLAANSTFTVPEKVNDNKETDQQNEDPKSQHDKKDRLDEEEGSELGEKKASPDVNGNQASGVADGNTSVNPDSPNIEMKNPDDVSDDGLPENEYFTTSIIDKEVVTTEEYSFVIRQKEHDYLVKRTDVFLNNTLEQFDRVLTLKDGENTITVTVSYEAKDGKLFSVSKTYIIYLKKDELIIYSNLEDSLVVNKQLLTFNASAELNGKKVPVSVYLNDAKLERNNGNQFEASLIAGENKIVIAAEQNGLKAEEIYRVFYDKKNTELLIETDLIDQEVPSATFSFYAIASAGKETVPLSTKFNGKSIEDDGKGNYSITLKEGENTLKLTAHNGKETLTQDYVVTYVIPGDGDGEGNEHAPSITVHDIEDGETIKNSIRTFHVKASDYNGKSLTGGNGTISATNNGNAINVDWNDSEKISFTLKVVNGRNHIVITAKDREGNTSTYELTVNGQVGEDGDVIGVATVTLEATTIGLGHLIPAEEVEIYQGERASAVLDRLMKKHGFDYEYTGQHDSSFYLSAIYKTGVVTNPVIPSDLAELLKRDMDRFDPEDYYPDSLGEFDFTNGSGWMYSVNGVYPNVGFADYYLKDGDHVRIRFTLAYGADIGGGMPGTNYHKEW